MQEQNHYRHEYKYEITYVDYYELRARLGCLMQRDPHVDADGRYRVHSLYFDNCNDTALREKIDGVAEVSAHYEIANGFQSLQKVLNIASMVIIIVLFVVSLFIISNTVKLAMYSRSEEIAIMKMVGATNSFIRLPFVVEGFILGMLGAVIAFFLEWGLYDFLQAKIAVVDTLRLFQIVPFAEVIELVAISYALTGFAVGVMGSLLSIRKFLKV